MVVNRVAEVSEEILVITLVFVICLVIDKFIVQKIRKKGDIKNV